MNEADVIRLIRQVIRQEITPILMGQVISNQSQSRSSVARFSEAPIGNLRSIQPFGISSRAPQGTSCLVVPVDGNPTHLNIVGHFDEMKPALEDGEACLYGAAGQVIFMKTGGSIHQGSKQASSPAVLGDVLVELLSTVLKAFLDAPQIGQGPSGPVFLDPGIRSTLEAELSVHLQALATNILSQNIFVERGP